MPAARLTFVASSRVGYVFLGAVPPVLAQLTEAERLFVARGFCCMRLQQLGHGAPGTHQTGLRGNVTAFPQDSALLCCFPCCLRPSAPCSTCCPFLSLTRPGAPRASIATCWSGVVLFSVLFFGCSDTTRTTKTSTLTTLYYRLCPRRMCLFNSLLPLTSPSF